MKTEAEIREYIAALEHGAAMLGSMNLIVASLSLKWVLGESPEQDRIASEMSALLRKEKSGENP